MHRIVRTSLFTLFLLVFLIGAPIVVLYTAGYRYSPINGHVVRTGALSVVSTPRGAHISLNDTPTGKKSPYIFNRVIPGTYTVTLSTDDSHEYKKTVTIESGRTTYLGDVTLFARSEPVLLADDDAARVTPALKSQTTGTVTLVPNKTAVEVRKKNGDALIALLPLDTYTIAEDDGDISVLTSSSGKLYLLDATADAPILLSANGTIFAWNSKAQELVWSDGIEVNMYRVSQHVSTFITRQGDPILSLTMFSDAHAIVVTTKTSARAFVQNDNVPATLLLTVDSIEDLWIADDDTTLYFLGTENGTRGIYELVLR